jgi:UDP-2,3-diacylglucosamine pyrophosphatase LpxH
VNWSAVDAPIPAWEARVTRQTPLNVLFIGDLHLDNPKSDRVGLKRVLDDAVAAGAAIFLLGDVFDAMQGRNDMRGSKSDLSARYIGRDDYLTALVEDVTEFLTPYAANVALLLQGNHESSAAKHYGLHLEQALAYELRKAGSNVVTPGYQTYCAFKFAWGDDTSNSATVPFWLTHGSGGGGPVTRGVIQAQRRAVTYPDARFVVSGHVHNSYFVAHEQHRLRPHLSPYDTEQEHYVVGAWKNEHVAKGGWWVERGGNPRLPSAWRASFWRARGKDYTDPVRWEFTRVVP